MNGAVALQTLIAGLATGAAYGLIALGFTLVHRLTAVIAFAHGDIVVGAVFVAVLAVVGRTPAAIGLSPGSASAFVVLAMAAGAALSMAVYIAAIRPFRARARVGRAGDVIGWAAATPFRPSSAPSAGPTAASGAIKTPARPASAPAKANASRTTRSVGTPSNAAAPGSSLTARTSAPAPVTASARSTAMPVARPTASTISARLSTSTPPPSSRVPAVPSGSGMA